eukprot:CAMPEP_0170628728 /NCGR_PEP_ID=MMETSP0224-20130122/32878_1 /TAXON_ID=285029 /ORGANISM="Togula jolla, Strain CCCM 725" /LENGTH=72 /DNA_ID=CAMNT_0010956251 /DNA_START=281 /DNA_END=495 /DNA_ORIENTATION=-
MTTPPLTVQALSSTETSPLRPLSRRVAAALPSGAAHCTERCCGRMDTLGRASAADAGSGTVIVTLSLVCVQV